MASLSLRSRIALTGGVSLLALLGLAATLHGRPRPIARATVGIDLEQASLMMDRASPPPPPPSPALLELAPRKLIRTARLELEVAAFEPFEAACRDLAQRHGYLADLRITREENGRRRAELTLKLAAERFETGLAAFKALGLVKREEVSVEDVTRACADLEARLANKRLTAQRLRELIAHRAGKLSEVVEAEKALGEITGDLESLEAQKRATDGQLAYSTLQAEVSEPGTPVSLGGRLGAPFAAAVREGFSGLLAGLAFALKALIATSPLLLALVLGVFGIRRWRRGRERS